MPSSDNKGLPPVPEAHQRGSSLRVLTPREREVLKLVAKGLANAEIADRLFISKHTVKNHVSSIYRKLNVDDRTQVALLAIRKGLVSVD